jgi:hypothetical protein
MSNCLPKLLDWVRLVLTPHTCSLNHSFAGKVDNVSKASEKTSQKIFFIYLILT